jgi:hypothetical protein
MLGDVFFVVLPCPDRSFLIDAAGLTVGTARNRLICSCFFRALFFHPTLGISRSGAHARAAVGCMPS